MEFFCIWTGIAIVTGAITCAIASAKGRNVVGWFFIGLGAGFVLGVIGAIIVIIIIACQSNLQEEQNYRVRVDMENRRLREQLYQERIKSESFRGYTQQRLDMHDQHLGIDTRSAAAALEQSVPTAYLPDRSAGPTQPQQQAQRGFIPPAPIAVQPEVMWYYEMQGQSMGPVSAQVIMAMLASGQLQSSSLVWCEGLRDWVPVAQVPQFNGASFV